MAHFHDDPHAPRQSSRNKWILLGFLAIGAFFLFTEHRAHLYGVLPYLLVLACPLMHLFHGHGGHHAAHHRDDNQSDTMPAEGKSVPSHDHGASQS